MLFNKSILVVEDHPIIAMTLENILADAGYQDIHFVENAEDALKAMADMRLSIIITDLDLSGDPNIPMPQRIEQGGFRVLEEAQKRGIPALIVSGSVAFLNDIPGATQNIRDISFVDKPVNAHELLSKVETLLNDANTVQSPLMRDAAMTNRLTRAPDHLPTLDIGKS